MVHALNWLKTQFSDSLNPIAILSNIHDDKNKVLIYTDVYGCGVQGTVSAVHSAMEKKPSNQRPLPAGERPSLCGTRH